MSLLLWLVISGRHLGLVAPPRLQFGVFQEGASQLRPGWLLFSGRLVSMMPLCLLLLLLRLMCLLPLQVGLVSCRGARLCR